MIRNQKFNSQMSRFSFIALAISVLSVVSCKNDTPESMADTRPIVNDSRTTGAGSYAKAVLPDLNNPTTQLLLKTFWIAEHWVNHADNSQNKPNKCRWWRFNEDGTFSTGQWEDTYSYGTWVLHYDQGKEYLHLDAVDDGYDMEFEIQAFSQLKDYMSWSGTRTYGLERIAVKAVSLLTMPTKAQFGVVE